MKVSIVARTLFSRFVLFILMAIYFVPFLILLILPRAWGFETKFYYWMEYIFCWIVLKSAFIPISYSGLENIPHEPAIIVANHQSSLDIPLIITVLRGRPHVWTAMKYLMGSPILRFILPKIAVLVDTSSPMAGMRTLLAVIKRVNGTHTDVVIFPEGGRFGDGKIHDFFAGFVILAKKMNRPVVPIFIKGVREVYAPDSFWVNYEPMSITVGKPLIKGENEQDEIFHDRVYHWFVEQNKE